MSKAPNSHTSHGSEPVTYELYAFWRSAATYRVCVALAIKDLTAHEHFINLDTGAQHSATYRAVNPLGGIPALVCGL